MSIALMTAAFKAPIPTTRKFVLLALCDSANDQGECYPSVPVLMSKCSAGERTVQEAISRLEADGYLKREFRTGRSTVYWIADPRVWRTPAAAAPPRVAHPTPAVPAPLPPQQPHPTPAAAAPITISEPSEEPKEKTARKRAPAAPISCPDGVDEAVWRDWLVLRKAKNAPVTPTVIEGAIGEAAKAGMSLDDFLRIWCRRGTQGLEADWLKSTERGQGASQPAEPAWRTEQRERTAAFAGPAAAKPRTTATVIDMEHAYGTARRLD